MVSKKSGPLVFVSHSHADKEIATQIKYELESRFTIQVFVAHEDILPTEEWQDTILKKLGECDAFLALLTRKFQLSNWTDQEVGVAVYLHKIVIPVKIDANPYGFISKYQAFGWDRIDTEDNVERLIGVLIEKRLVSTAALIIGLKKSVSFRDATLKSELLRKIKKLSAKQINEIGRAAVDNNQVYDSFKAQANLRKLFSKNRNVIESRLLGKLSEHHLI